MKPHRSRAEPLAALVYAEEEVICMRKVFLAAFMATMLLMALSISAGATAIPPCCF
ncbi:MAG TPA: hypothetical protein VIO37_10500 [Candidatus Dormibacteraeota bacterium]